MRARTRMLVGLAIGVVGAAAMAACGASSGSPGAAGAPAGEKLAVVATTTQVADFVRNVGGDKVAVTQIIKANVDPHDFEPSPADVANIGKAKLVVKSGVGLEKWLDQTVSAAGFAGTMVDASKGVTIRQAKDEPEGDPHIWHNPRNAKIMVANIEAALSASDARNAATYKQNLTAYQAKLDKLDADIEAKINTIPPGQRTLVTDHDALGYYVDRYGLEFVGSVIPTFDTSAELSSAQITDLVAKIKATGVKAIFVSSSLPPKTSEAIAAQAGVKVVAGEDSLYADTLGPVGSPGGTYIDALTHNTDVIVTALRG